MANPHLCPYCSFPVRRGDPLVTCPACRARYHADCWRENGGCAVYGCHGAPGANRPEQRGDDRAFQPFPPVVETGPTEPRNPPQVPVPLQAACRTNGCCSCLTMLGILMVLMWGCEALLSVATRHPGSGSPPYQEPGPSYPYGSPPSAGDRVCPYCGGSGSAQCSGCSGTGACTWCRGTGKTRCFGCAGTGYTRCSQCGGYGMTRDGARCQACSGTGWQVCETCRGSGLQPCYSCQGRGTTPDGRLCTQCNGTGARPCSLCSGTGRCTQCGGDGRVRCPACAGRGRF